MCWLRSGDEKSIPGFPEASPSTSQHPSQAEELVIWQFSSAPWTAPQIRLHIPTRPRVPGTVTGTMADGRDGLAPTSMEACHLVQEKILHQGKPIHTVLGVHSCYKRTLPANVALNFHSCIWLLLNSCCVPGSAPDTEGGRLLNE